MSALVNPNGRSFTIGSLPFHMDNAKHTRCLHRRCRPARLAPAVGSRPRLVMAEVVPGFAPFAVVLTHGPPLTLAQGKDPRSSMALFPSALLGAGIVRHSSMVS